MTTEDFKIIAIKDPKDEIYTVFPKGLPGVVVQTSDLDGVEKKLSEAFKSMLKYSISEFGISKFDFDENRIPGL